MPGEAVSTLGCTTKKPAQPDGRSAGRKRSVRRKHRPTPWESLPRRKHKNPDTPTETRVVADRKLNQVFDLPCCISVRWAKAEMITMDMIGKIRRPRRWDHLSEREVARKTGLSRNTVRKWLHGTGVQAHAV